MTLRDTASVVLIALLASAGSSQNLPTVDRERAQVMLRTVADDVQKYYYDPKLHGVRWDTNVDQAKEKIAKATSLEAATLEIAALLEPLNDSHTFFVPPQDPIPQEYGWRFQVIGAHCYVTHVRPKSDAEARGVRPGDEVLSLDGFTPTREGLDKIEYAISVLVPQSRLRADVRDAMGKIHHVEIKAKVRQARAFTDVGDMTGRDTWGLGLENEDEHHRMRPQSKDLGPKLMVMKLPEFPYPDLDAQDMIGKARKHSSLVLDLRGNPGGAETTLQDLLGGVFEHDIKIADRVTREKTTPVLAKADHHPFTGQLIVLVDSSSGSAAELFARVVQIEKRGIILGDRSSGSVMESKHYGHRVGSNPEFFYGVSISSADLVMTDGKSLEHVGVIPDETVLPAAADLANDRDPVMAHAAEMAGVPLTSAEAGKLFPYEWPRP